MELVKAANMIGQRCEPKHIEEKSLARAHSRVLAKLESQQGGLDFVSLAVRALATSALQPRSVLCSRGALGSLQVLLRDAASSGDLERLQALLRREDHGAFIDGLDWARSPPSPPKNCRACCHVPYI